MSKWCPTCGHTKEETEFYKDYKGILFRYCKGCSYGKVKKSLQRSRAHFKPHCQRCGEKGWWVDMQKHSICTDCFEHWVVYFDRHKGKWLEWETMWLRFCGQAGGVRDIETGEVLSGRS